MYMLEHWFSARRSVSVIKDGSRTITHARLFTDDISISEHCLYVGRTTDFFPDSISNEVMMIYKNDIISVTSNDLNAVFNEVLEIFDYYREIEKQLRSAVFEKAPEQKVLSACETLMGPMFIFSPDYHILACSQNYSDQYVNMFWDSFSRDGEPTLEMVTTMKNSNVTKLMLRNPYLASFVEPKAKPFSYGIIHTYTTVFGKVLGYLIIASNKAITKFEEDMAEIIIHALDQIQAGTTKPSDAVPLQTSDEVLFSKLISGNDTIRTEQYLSAIHGLTFRNYFCIVIAQPQDPQILPFVHKFYRKKFRNCIATREDLQSIFLVWSNHPITAQEIIRIISNSSSNEELFWGISNTFHHLTDAIYYCDQAKFALSFMKQPISLFCQCAIRYLLQMPSGEYHAHARHPMVVSLEEKQEKNGKELLDTLREYLMCERSVKQAAQKLYVHRNTVNYRIDQIRAIEEIDLNNPYERQYILLSLL